LDFCDEISIPINFDVYYSSTLLQPKFNNLITILNEESNGGYEFLDYQWYRIDVNQNVEALEGEINSYYYVGDNKYFEDGDCYYLEVTRASDLVKTRSCPVCPTTQTDLDDIFSSDITISATLLNSNQTILINGLNGGYVKLYTLTGLLVNSYDVEGDMIVIPAPIKSGFYILQIQSESDLVSYKIRVK
jgi:hypothetical protein